MIRTTDDEALPTVLAMPASFMKRLPSQRLLDLLKRLEPEAALNFAEFANAQGLRVTVFQWLLREYPGRDPTSLWLHSYDVEVDLVEESPTNGSAVTPSPLSALTGTAFPAT